MKSSSVVHLLGSGTVWQPRLFHYERLVIPTAVERVRAFISARVGRRDLVFSIALETLLLKHKVSQGYSPAGENAGSLTPFEMTHSKSDAVMEKSKLYHYHLLSP